MICRRLCIVFFFFFSSRRRHTRFDCDWSSDVCSSDLGRRRELLDRDRESACEEDARREREQEEQNPEENDARSQLALSCERLDRKSVVWGKSVDLGGRRIIKKKKKK